MARLFVLVGCLLFYPLSCFSNSSADNITGYSDDMVTITSGAYTPLYKQDGVARDVTVASFRLDRFQVTNRQFMDFVAKNPAWQRDTVSPLFADPGYLSQMQGALQDHPDQPVTNVSWYAAMAYCKAQGKTLPSVDQWEYAAQADNQTADASNDPEFKRRILDWYAQPTAQQLPVVQDTEMNFWGAHGMHGVVWELVSDFNSSLTTGESRGDSELDKQLFCGSGAALAVDPGDYAAFMRYALRGSYKANYTLSSMGFRCAAEI